MIKLYNTWSIAMRMSHLKLEPGDLNVCTIPAMARRC